MTFEFDSDGFLTDRRGALEGAISRVHGGLLSRARQVNRDCHELLFAIDIRNRDVQGILVTTLLLRALEHYQATLILLGMNIIAPAKVTLRALLESVFATRAIAADRGALRAFINDDLMQRRKLINKARQHDHINLKELCETLTDDLIEALARAGTARGPLGKNSPFGEALRPPAPDGEGASSYLYRIHRTLWSWADERHRNQLDGGRRQGRPPVLKPHFAANNMLVPPSGSHADEIRTAIAREHRHRHFASLRSSQALTQSVFGAMAAFGRLDLLEGVTAECGRPAFFTDHRTWTLAFEHEVDRLGEPRPSSLDVLLSGPDGRVAVECKFTEAEFGTCSRNRRLDSA